MRSAEPVGILLRSSSSEPESATTTVNGRSSLATNEIHVSNSITDSSDNS